MVDDLFLSLVNIELVAATRTRAALVSQSRFYFRAFIAARGLQCSRSTSGSDTRFYFMHEEREANLYSTKYALAITP